MKRLLNTLYVTTPDSYLSKDGTNVVVSNQGKELFRIPIQNLEAILTFGYQGASPGVMRLCVDHGVALSFYSPIGRFISRIQGPTKGNVVLRINQYEKFRDKDFALHLANVTVSGKIYNSRVALRRFVRDYPDHKDKSRVEQVSEQLKWRIKRALIADSAETLRGIEGESSALYFSVFSSLILSGDTGMVFTNRNRRPPTDPVNAMLSFGYSLLAADCTAALEGVGLDASIGFMHSPRSGRQSMALDMMEELRSYIVDRHVLSMINNRQITSKDFLQHTETGDDGSMGVVLTEQGRKKFLAAWQTRKKKEIIHPYLNEKAPIGLLPHLQALLMARYLRGDIDDYPVFFSK